MRDPSKAVKSRRLVRRDDRSSANWFSRFFWGTVRLVFATAVYFCVLVIASYFVIGFFIKGEELPAPDLVAKSVSEAMVALQSEDLSIKLIREEPSDILARGEIIRQDPKQGARIKKRTPIKVVVSSGPKLITLPDKLIGMKYQQAGILLRDLDLKPGHIAYLPRSGDETESVLSIDPPVGTGVPPGTEIGLLVSIEMTDRQFIMPGLLGLPLARAREVLDKHHLLLGETRIDGSLTGAGGTVQGQTPPPGAPVEAGAEVDLILAPEF